MTAETDICAGCSDPIGEFIGIFFLDSSIYFACFSTYNNAAIWYGL